MSLHDGISDPLALTAEDAHWVAATRDSLTIEQKIAQLFILSTREDTEEEALSVAELGVGGVHRFPTGDLEATWRATRRVLDESAVPPILSGDIEGGTLSYSFATAMPNQMGIAAVDDVAVTEALARIVATECRSLGYDWSFTPVVDINRAFRNPVVGTRSYGSDADRVLRHARAYVRTLQAHGMAATAKHWPGDGIDDRDQHLATSVNPLDLDEWHASFGRIYGQLIADGVMTVMTGHIALPSFIRSIRPDAGRDAFCPATVSDLLNRVLLREMLGFRGLIVSDATVMGGLTSWAERAEAAPAVIENGCDAFLFSREPREDMAFVLQGLRTGRLSEGRLDEAVTRMLSLKARLGLHRRTVEDRVPPLDVLRETLARPENEAIARDAAARSLTLVKNVDHVLPLDPVRHRRVVVLQQDGESFFAGAIERDFAPLKVAMAEAGFDLRPFDPDAFPCARDTDLILYLVGQEATPGLGTIELDFAQMHGGSRKAMAHFNKEVPTVMISFGQPYFLYDAPNYGTYINAYCPLPAQQIALVERLLGKAEFTGISPVDPFCGMEQLQW